ncbi:hypothetical protein DENSPDRAFT_851217 [Dentipellis sp. KUC8613]|nr:hypothetical protein DENSPDRAFT_851217 [Dentipellis sp. KUC8613]
MRDKDDPTSPECSWGDEELRMSEHPPTSASQASHLNAGALTARAAVQLTKMAITASALFACLSEGLVATASFVNIGGRRPPMECWCMGHSCMSAGRASSFNCSRQDGSEVLVNFDPLGDRASIGSRAGGCFQAAAALAQEKAHETRKTILCLHCAFGNKHGLEAFSSVHAAASDLGALSNDSEPWLSGTGKGCIYSIERRQTVVYAYESELSRLQCSPKVVDVEEMFICALDPTSAAKAALSFLTEYPNPQAVSVQPRSVYGTGLQAYWVHNFYFNDRIGCRKSRKRSTASSKLVVQARIRTEVPVLRSCEVEKDGRIVE